MHNELVYDRIVPQNRTLLSNEHSKVLEWVGSDKKILEVACHTGYISAWLKKNNCEVHGVEIYEPALEKAKQYLEKAILGNIEDDITWHEIEKTQYDVVLFMHVLEHLVRPEEVLSRAQKVLKEEGVVIICLPNISNWVNRIDALRGNFNYTETGVMDKTHLKFYNFFTAKAMINESGYKVDVYSGVSWKVAFRLFPRMRGFWRLNNIYNRIIHKIFGPNFTDKVLMFKCSKQ